MVKGETLYRVRWVGYAAADDSWLAFADMNGACARAALDYIRSQSDSPDDADEPVQDHRVDEWEDDIPDDDDAVDDDYAVDDDDVADDAATPDAAAAPAAEVSPPVDVAPSAAVAAREARLAARQARMGLATSSTSSKVSKQLEIDMQSQ